MASRSNISFDELLGAIDRSGLPLGNSFDMRQAQLGSRDRLKGQFGDRGASKFNQGIMKQIDQIAQMDKQLSGVYSDPNSQLFIEDPSKREGAIFGHRNTGFGQVENLARERDTRLQQQEDDVSAADSLFADLTRAQSQLEAEERKLESRTKKAQSTSEKSSRVIKNESGETVFELSKQQARQARNAKVNMQDAKAVSEFFNRSTPAFRKWLEDEGIDGNIPQGALSAREIKEFRMRWEAANKKKKKSSSSSDDFIKALENYASGS